MNDSAVIAKVHSAREEIQALIRRTCWLLDKEDFAAWLETFEDTGTYEVVAYSPEIKREMCWLRGTRNEMQTLFKERPNHVREDARRAHMIMEIDLTVDAGAASAMSRFTIFKTNQRGETQVYAVGVYEDRLSDASGAWKFSKRRVVLDTRMFDVFPHMTPL